jgi:hypothetical protein
MTDALSLDDFDALVLDSPPRRLLDVDVPFRHCHSDL